MMRFKKSFLILFIFFISLISTFLFANEVSFDDSSEEAFFQMEEQIVVSASKRAQKLSDAPVAISVITADDIKMYGAQSIAEVLRMVPGVYVQETTGGQQDVSIRGLSNGPKQSGAFASYSRNILVMIDGRSYFNDVFGGTFWEFLPITIDDIDRIEVVRGPASALFGANAVTGVVNIITKDYKKTKGVYISTSLVLNSVKTSAMDDKKFGTLTSVRYGNEGKKFSFRVSGEISQKNAYDNMSYNHTYGIYQSNRQSLLADADKGFPTNPDYPSTDKDALGVYRLSSFMTYKITDKSSLSLQLGRSQGSVNLTGTSGDLMICNYDNLENNVAKLTYQYNDLKISASNIFGILGEHVKHKDTNEEDQDGMDWNSLDIDIQNVFSISDKDILVAGFNWRKVESNADDVYFRDMKEKSQKFIAGFLNNEYKLTDSLKWIIGARFDKYDTPDKSKLSPQSILFYKPKDDQTFRLMYSQAIRAPFIADLFTNAQFSAGTLPDGNLAPIIRLMPNEDLNPMTIRSYEFGYSTIIKKINFDLNVYHYETKDMVAYDVNTHDSLTFVNPGLGPIYAGGTAIPLSSATSSALDLGSTNLDGKFKANGAELNMNYNLSKSTRIWGNYSYQNSKFQDKTYKGTPSHLASLGTFKNLTKGWSFSGSINYVSSSEVSITNVMDQTLAQINKDLAANPVAFITAAKTGSDPYKSKYLTDGAYIYQQLNGNVINQATATTFYNNLVAWGMMSAANAAKLQALWNPALGLSDAEASFLATAGGAPVSLAGTTLNIGGYNNTPLADTQVGAASARAVNGELYKMSAQSESREKVEDYLFINLRLAKRIMKDNGEIALSASLRPDRRQYAFGEKTGDKFIATFSYKF
ncbi:MAG TPA: TonB-dependent receptor [bacterium]|nr:TonB-dependent receptor [bacterium]